MNREELVNKMKEFTEDEYAEPFYNAKQCADIAEEYAKELEGSKWVSVDERLPEYNGFVIAHKRNGMVLGLYFNSEKEFKYCQINQTPQVTHWQPLPPHPTTKTISHE